jgi:zinc transport system substrate-binding protein
MVKKIAIFMLLAILLIGCSRDNYDNTRSIFVSITPLKMLVEEVTCGDFPVEVLVPEGASPETYDPTARQLTAAGDAQMLFTTGLITFEQNLVKRIANDANIVDLSEGITILHGSCTHNHGTHKHGIDPHIWTSPRALYTMVSTIQREVMERYPDSTKYNTAAQQLLERIKALDIECGDKITENGVKTMMIYHPAYTYYARDYNIKQVAIEHDGKEPSPRQLTALINEAMANNIHYIFIQPQYSADKVKPLAKECGAEIVVTNPLASDILSEIERVTELICTNHAE